MRKLRMLLCFLLVAASLLGLAACGSEPVTEVLGKMDAQQVSTGANDSFDYVLYDDGTVGITKYKGGYTRHTIPAEIDGHQVSRIEEKAYYHCGLVKVEIPDSVIYIGANAFAANADLKKVTLSQNVQYIGEKAFFGCAPLKQLDIPATLDAVGGYAFSGTAWYENLTDEFTVVGNGILIKYFGTQSEVTIPANVRFISSAFGSLIGKAGEYMVRFTAVTVPDTVEILGDYAFAECGYLETVSLPDNLKSIGRYAFCDCSVMESITLPNSIPEIKEATFFSCERLKALTIPDSVTTIGPNAFYYCISLAELNLGAGVTSFDNSALDETDWLETFTVSPENQSFCVENFCLYNKDKTHLQLYYHGKTDTIYTAPETLQSIGRGAFDENEALKEVVLPESIQTIGASALYNCAALEYVTIGSGLTTIGNAAFNSCSALISVYFTGTRDQWNSVTVEKNNSILNNIYVECDYVR